MTDPLVPGRLKRGIAVAVLAFAVMLPCVGNGFSRMDDPSYAVYDPAFHQMSAAGIARFFQEPHLGVYAPLSFLSHTLTYYFLGPTAGAAHTVNLLLHAANAFLVFWFLSSLFGSLNAAFFAAALFAVHPVNVEPVAWATERMTLLCSFFYLGALIAYVRSARSGRRGSEAAVLLFFCAALFSKPFAVTLPAVLVLVDAVLLGRRKLWASMVKKWPYFLLSALTIFTTAWVASQPELTPRLLSGEALRRALLSSHAVVFYGANLLWPLKLSVFYPIGPPSAAQAYLSVLGIGLVLAMGWSFRKREPALMFATLFFLIVVFPLLPWLQIRHSFVADRYAYLPSIGIFFAIAVVSARLRIERVFLRALAVSTVAVLALLSFQRSSLWRSDILLLEDAIRKYPTGLSAFAYSDLGTEYLLRGQNEKAINLFNESLRREPSFAPALNNRGYAYAAKNEPRKAWEDFNAAIAGDPYYAEAYLNRARMEAAAGRRAAAAADLDLALTLSPGMPDIEAFRDELRAHAAAAVGDEEGAG